MNKFADRMRYKAAPLLAVAALLLQGCATTDDLYADYNCGGCPEQVHLISWEPAIYFGFDSSLLVPEEQARLDSNYLLLKENPEFRLVLRGFTDSFGRKSYNDRLARRRANAAEGYFTALGIDASRILRAPLGESGALSPTNNSAVARAVNRRVEMMMIDSDEQPVRMRVHAAQAVEAALRVGDEGNRTLREFDEVGGTGVSLNDELADRSVEADARRIEDKAQRAMDDIAPEMRPGAWWEPAVYFSDDTNELGGREKDRLKQLEVLLDLNPDITMVVRGYFDAFGNRQRNEAIAAERVRAVYRHLRKVGVSSDQIFVAPLAESASPEDGVRSAHDRTASQRVEFLPVDIDGRPVRLLVSDVQQVERGSPQPETQ